MAHLTRAIWALFSIVVHLCIGAGCYAFFVADAVNTGSAKFWAWIGAWPLMLIITFWGTVSTILIWIVGAVVALAVVALIVGTILHIRENNRWKA